MDLDDTLDQQLRQLIDGMRKLTFDYDTPPSPEVWKFVLVEWMQERADFIERYVIPKIEKMLNGEKLWLPQRPVSIPLEAPLNTTRTPEEHPAFLRRHSSTDNQVVTEESR